MPGHGRTATYPDLERYIEMLATVRGRIAALIADGATLEQVVAAQPTKEWDERYGNPTTFFLDRAYKSLRRKPASSALRRVVRRSGRRYAGPELEQVAGLAVEHFTELLERREAESSLDAPSSAPRGSAA